MIAGAYDHRRDTGLRTMAEPELCIADGGIGNLPTMEPIALASGSARQIRLAPRAREASVIGSPSLTERVRWPRRRRRSAYGYVARRFIM